MTHNYFFGPGGPIARKLATYEPRPQQVAMADAVAQAIADGKHLMAEAGTGVGKSFGYLVPAILAALKEEEARVVVSTHTISLQEQLVQKDIPFLQSVIDKPFKALLVKGRSNYLSKRRLRVAQQRHGNLLGGWDAIDQLQEVGNWAKKTRDGSKSDLGFRPLPAVWDLVESDTGNCLGKKCKDYAECFYFKARRSIHEAKVLVVNHALFFSDLFLRSTLKDRSILPDYHVAILDEAHTLEDVAAEHMGLSVTRGQVTYLLNKLLHERKGGEAAQGLLTLHGGDDAWNQVLQSRQAALRFFTSIQDWRREQEQKARRGDTPRETIRVRKKNIVANELSRELQQLASVIDQIGKNIKNEEEQIELDAAANRCGDLAAQLDSWLEQKMPDQVYWLEAGGEEGKRLKLASAPIDVAPILREQLFKRVRSVVLTSATLSVGGLGGFRHFQDRLGFEGNAEQLGSPFNFRKQVELHLFRKMPDPSAPAYEDACLEKIQDYVLRTRGRAFVLFTSHWAMANAAERLRGFFKDHDIDLLAQSDGVPSTQMVQRFRQTPQAVIFGVDTFWQGVDVQGEALSNVIITKLPFVPPDRPLVEARCDALNNSGGYAFFDYSLPQAVIKLKQGFGRLIRTKTDTGLVVILDPRVVTKSYGRHFLDALPECTTFVDGVEC
ncbi:MAG: ATP-dependent DNA helicase [Gemmataceae bacterium]|nr:ATP-dependent DNA helicase [Gemmataceae bacterium]